MLGSVTFAPAMAANASRADIKAIVFFMIGKDNKFLSKKYNFEIEVKLCSNPLLMKNSCRPRV
jgi:hypothetical protein